MHRDILVSRDASALTGSVSVDLGFPPAAIRSPSNLRGYRTTLKQFTQELRLRPARGRSSGCSAASTPMWTAIISSACRRLAMTRSSTLHWRRHLCRASTTASALSTIRTTPTCRTRHAKGAVRRGQLQVQPVQADRWRPLVRLPRKSVDSISGGLFSADDDRTDTTKSNGVSPRGIISWEPNRSFSLNVQAAKGFRLGGVNDPLNIPLCSGSDMQTFGGFQTYKDETLWNYEAGFKYSKHGVTFNAAAFYNDIKNLQVTLDAGSCSSRIVFNVPKAHAEGIEAELSVHPLVGLDLSFAGSLLNSKFGSRSSATARSSRVYARATACRRYRSINWPRRPITRRGSTPTPIGM